MEFWILTLAATAGHGIVYYANGDAEGNFWNWFWNVAGLLLMYLFMT